MKLTHWPWALGLFVTMSLGETCPVAAQDIVIQNPSIEGTPKPGWLPVPWLRAENSPDVQPGFYHITLPASHGRTYAGFIHSQKYSEGISQRLPVAMKAGVTYQLSFDLAYAPRYDTLVMCAGSLAVYGGNTPEEKADTLWESGAFYHETWKRYTIQFTPRKDYAYISFHPYLHNVCSSSKYTSCLLDNITAALAVVPTVKLSTVPTCKGSSKGSITATVTGGTGPYTYSWQPGGQTNSSIHQLPEGAYGVTVKSASGASITTAANVNGYTVMVKAVTATPRCYGEKDGTITLAASDGLPPYRYSIHGGHFRDNPVFPQLAAGNYQFEVQDSKACETTLHQELAQPGVLRIAAVHKQNVTCNESLDGKIILTMEGGTPPYSYRMEEQTAWQPENGWQRLDAGTYRYKIKDERSCETDSTTTLTRHERVCDVYVPTAFSPNGDGANDVFRAKINDDIRDYRLSVYSRWGNAVFDSHDPAISWNGRYQQQELPAGAYIWVLLYTDSKNQARRQQGTVMLVR